MKYTFTVTAAALTAVSALTLLGMYLTREPSPRQASQIQENQPILQQELPPVKKTEDFEYILAEYDGRLAVFGYNELAPKKVFDVYVSTLPPYDRELLAQGIGVTDYEELVVLLEDYIS